MAVRHRHGGKPGVVRRAPASEGEPGNPKPAGASKGTRQAVLPEAAADAGRRACPIFAPRRAWRNPGAGRASGCSSGAISIRT
jgi:hypothetical protein